MSTHWKQPNNEKLVLDKKEGKEYINLKKNIDFGILGVGPVLPSGQ